MRSDKNSLPFTKCQAAEIAAAARLFRCTESEMVVALAMGSLVMFGGVAGLRDDAEHALTVQEFIRDHTGRKARRLDEIAERLNALAAPHNS